MNALRLSPSSPVVVLLRSDASLKAPLGPLTALLADAIDALFGDAVTVAHLVPPGSERPDARVGGVRHLWIAAPDDDRVAGIVRTLAGKLPGETRYLFLDVSSRQRGFSRRIEGAVTQLVHLTPDQEGPIQRPTPGCAILRSVTLPPHARPNRLSPRQSWVASLARGAAADLTGERPSSRGHAAPYPPASRDPAWCRLRLDFEALARLDRPRYRDLPAAARETVGRWARALTRRRVGLALGGAGAWGFAGAALILELASRGVPIDLIGGASSGALIGGYYCHAGLSGLERLIDRGPDFARGMPLMTLTGAVAEYAVNADLGGARLETLETPLFPVTTNLSSLRPEVVTSGTIGVGVRASVSAPGIFAPTFLDGSMYVDGAVSDNVPVGLVESMGADLVIVANALPAAARPAPRLLDHGRIGRHLEALNPLGRLRNFATSFDLLLHNAGEPEASARRVVYSADPVEAPLRSTFDYGASRRIVTRVRRDDARFHAAVEAATTAFQALARPEVRRERVETGNLATATVIQ